MAHPIIVRFFGGPPAAVLIRLLVLSLIVGAVLFWLDVRPDDIVDAISRFALRLWRMGFDGLRQAAEYILVGAMIVVPVWLVLRLMNLRAPR